MDVFIFLVALNSVLFCNAETLRQLLERAVKHRRHNVFTRRVDFQFDPHETKGIIGAPMYPSHLPEAEPIQPGHTLIRPALGMLKSAVKFPHRDLENGAGVNGNINNLGIRYGGKNERVLYTGFRRMPRDYVMVAPAKNGNRKPTFYVSPVVLDLDKGKNTLSGMFKSLKKLRKPAKRDLIIYVLDPLETDKSSSKHYEKLTGESDENYTSDSNIRDFQPKLNKRKELNIWQNLRDKLREFVKNEEHMFNHIKISQDAPEITDFVPDDKEYESGRPWWFFNQIDYKPFKD